MSDHQFQHKNGDYDDDDEEEFQSASEGESVIVEPAGDHQSKHSADYQPTLPEPLHEQSHSAQFTKAQQPLHNLECFERQQYSQQEQDVDQKGEDQPSWSSWWSSAVGALQESLQQDVNGITETVKTVGTGLVQVADRAGEQVYKRMEGTTTTFVGEGNDKAPESNKDQQQSQEHTASQQQSSNGAVQVGGIGEQNIAAGLTSHLDKAMDYSSDLLGTAVMTSLQRLNRVDLEKSRVVGQQLVKNGVGALEAIGSVVGSRAATLLMDQRTRQHEQERAQALSGGISRNSRGSQSVKQPQQRLAARRVATVHDYFDDNCGMAHLQALEMLAAEADLQVSDLMQKHKQSQSQNEVCDQTSQLEQSFQQPIVSGDQSVVESTVYQTTVGRLSQLGIGNTAQLDGVVKFLNNLDAELVKIAADGEQQLQQKPDGNSDDDSFAYYETVGRSQVKVIKNLSTKALADLGEKASEQLLRCAEIFLMAIAEYSMNNCNDGQSNKDEKVQQQQHDIDQIIAKSQVLRSIVVQLLAEIQLTATKFHDTLQEVSEQLQFYVDEAQAEKMREIIISCIASKDIDRDSTICSQFVIDAMQSLLPIMKLMALRLNELNQVS